MSLDAIKKSILSEAGARASAIDDEASSEAKRILKEADERAKSIIGRAERDAKAEAERLAKESQAGAETEASAMMLEAKGAAVERALKKVSAQVERAVSKDYSKKLLDSGLKQFKEISGDSPVIRTAKRNAGMLKGGKYRVEYEDIDGFILSTEDGKISLNATVQSVVGKSLDGARRLISKELFGEARKTQARAPKAKAKAPKPKKARRHPRLPGRGRRPRPKR